MDCETKYSIYEKPIITVKDLIDLLSQVKDPETTNVKISENNDLEDKELGLVFDLKITQCVFDENFEGCDSANKLLPPKKTLFLLTKLDDLNLDYYGLGVDDFQRIALWLIGRKLTRVEYGYMKTIIIDCCYLNGDEAIENSIKEELG